MSDATPNPQHGHARPDAGRRPSAWVPGRAVAWVVLVVSGLCEAVWAHAMGAGLDSPGRVTAFVLAMAASMFGLQLAQRTIPLGTAYAVWGGAGTAATALWSALTGTPFTPGKVVFLALIVVGIVGLELTTPAHKSR